MRAQERLEGVVAGAWRCFERATELNCRVVPAVPILFFGDQFLYSNCNQAKRLNLRNLRPRASRVAVYLDPADPADRDSWPRYRDWAIKTLGELRHTFSAAIKNLP